MRMRNAKRASRGRRNRDQARLEAGYRKSYAAIVRVADQLERGKAEVKHAAKLMRALASSWLNHVHFAAPYYMAAADLAAVDPKQRRPRAARRSERKAAA